MIINYDNLLKEIVSLNGILDAELNNAYDNLRLISDDINDINKYEFYKEFTEFLNNVFGDKIQSKRIKNESNSCAVAKYFYARNYSYQKLRRINVANYWSCLSRGHVECIKDVNKANCLADFLTFRDNFNNFVKNKVKDCPRSEQMTLQCYIISKQSFNNFGYLEAIDNKPNIFNDIIMRMAYKNDIWHLQFAKDFSTWSIQFIDNKAYYHTSFSTRYLLDQASCETIIQHYKTKVRPYVLELKEQLDNAYKALQFIKKKYAYLAFIGLL